MKSQANCLAETSSGVDPVFLTAIRFSSRTFSTNCPGVVGAGMSRSSRIHVSTRPFEPRKPCCLISRHNCEAFSQPSWWRVFR